MSKYNPYREALRHLWVPMCMREPGFDPAEEMAKTKFICWALANAFDEVIRRPHTADEYAWAHRRTHEAKTNITNHIYPSNTIGDWMVNRGMVVQEPGEHNMTFRDRLLAEAQAYRIKWLKEAADQFDKEHQEHAIS